MDRLQRILIEMFAPPFLGACMVMVRPSAADNFHERFFGFLPLVVAAYTFAIIPSLLYTAAMELWFWLGLRARCGLLCTVIVSAALGCGAGLAIEYVIDGQQILSTVFLREGALVGLLIGVYVSRQNISAA